MANLSVVKKTTPAAHVKMLLKELSDLGRNNAENQFRMCQILAAFKEQKLYNALGYDSFGAFAEGEELKLGKSSCAKWALFYVYAQEFGYNKEECIQILEHVSVNAAYGQMNLDEKKSSVPAFIKRCRKDYLSSKYQVNVSFDEKKDLDAVHRALMDHGMEISETGQRSFLSEAFLSLVKSKR